MRKRLLDATISTLYEKGYSGTTTLEVQRRAGVSRGGLLHHYSSRNDLILAAVEHLTKERISDAVSTVRGEPPENGRVAYAVRRMWETFDGSLYAVALELWVAARNDEDLRSVLVPQERLLGRAIRGLSAELFGRELSRHARFPSVLEMLTDAMRGAAARRPVRSGSSDERLLAEWIEAATVLLEAGPA
jgi:AcrR family transcriptional regulator